MSIDRRQHQRQSVRLLVQHQSQPEAQLEVDYAVDLSQSGLFLRTTAPLQPDAGLHLQFAPARDARVIDVFCRVARVTPEGVGAAFVHMDEAAQALLSEVLGQTAMLHAAMPAAASGQLRA